MTQKAKPTSKPTHLRPHGALEAHRTLQTRHPLGEKTGKNHQLGAHPKAAAAIVPSITEGSGEQRP